MPKLKNPALVISLNVLLLLAIVAVVVIVVRRPQASAPVAVPVQRVEMPPGAVGANGGPGLANAPGVPQEMLYALQASTEYRNGQYAQCMRDSDLALSLLRHQRQTKETHMVYAQVALIAARAAKASGSSQALTHYVQQIRSSASAVEEDPEAYPSEKKSIREVVAAAAAL